MVQHLTPNNAINAKKTELKTTANEVVVQTFNKW